MNSEHSEPNSTSSRYRPVPTIAEWTALQFSRVESSDELQDFKLATSAASKSDIDKVVDRLARKAAVESVAVEGFYDLSIGDSRSVATEASGWEKILESQSPVGLSLFGSQLTAFEYARRFATDNDRPISESFMREMHAIACKDQATYDVYVPTSQGLLKQSRPLILGEYKQYPNNVTQRNGQVHWYCDPLEASAEMSSFLELVTSATFANENPVIQAAYVHYCITHIHPFSDGNGRVARAVASVYTYRSYQVPLIVYSDRKQTYFQALEAANFARYGELANYVADRIVSTLSHAAQEYRTLSSPSSSQRLLELMESTSVYSSVTLEDIRSVASRLQQFVRERFDSRVDQIVANSNGQITASKPRVSGPGGNDRYTVIRYEHITFSISQPVQLWSQIFVSTSYARDLADRYAFCVATSMSDEVAFSPSRRPTGKIMIRFEDAWPSIGSDAGDRIEMLLDSAFADGLESIAKQLHHALYQAGQLEFPR